MSNFFKDELFIAAPAATMRKVQNTTIPQVKPPAPPGVGELPHAVLTALALQVGVQTLTTEGASTSNKARELADSVASAIGEFIRIDTEMFA